MRRDTACPLCPPPPQPDLALARYAGRARWRRELNVLICLARQTQADAQGAAEATAEEAPAAAPEGQAVEATEGAGGEAAGEAGVKADKSGQGKVQEDSEKVQTQEGTGEEGADGKAGAGGKEDAGESGDGIESKGVEGEGDKKAAGDKAAAKNGGGMGVKHTASFKNQRGGRGGGRGGGGSMHGQGRPLPRGAPFAAGGANPMAMMAQMTSKIVQQNMQTMMAAAANTPAGRAALMSVAMGGAVRGLLRHACVLMAVASSWREWGSGRRKEQEMYIASALSTLWAVGGWVLRCGREACRALAHQLHAHAYPHAHPLPHADARFPRWGRLRRRGLLRPCSRRREEACGEAATCAAR